jgi:hypothetical protein
VDDRLADLARSSANFGRLFGYQPLLALYGAQAEAVVFTDANAALVHMRQFGEVLAEELITRAGLRVHGDLQVHRLAVLADAGMLNPKIRAAFDTLRTSGNQAAHRHMFDTSRALEAIRLAWELGVWLHRALSGDRTVEGFVPPAEPVIADPAELSQLRQTLARDRQALAESKLRLGDAVDQAQAVARELRRRSRRGDDRPDPAQDGIGAPPPGRRGQGRSRLPVPAAGVEIRVRRRGVHGGTRLARRRASRRAGGAHHPDRQRRLDASRGEAGVH